MYVRWESPIEDAGYTSVQVERATTQTGTYSLIATQAQTDNTYFDASGTATSWYRIRFTDGTNYSAYSAPMKGNDAIGYVTLSEVRAMLKLQPAEYSDDDVQLFINKATKSVDESTGRTWQGILEVDNEFYDGNDRADLYMRRTDIDSIIALAVDQQQGAGFEVVPATQYDVTPEGHLSFPKAFKNVRVSYKFGNQAPTESVKELCLLYIAQFIKQDATRKERVNELVGQLRFKRPDLV